jgi:hypothetical protein
MGCGAPPPLAHALLRARRRAAAAAAAAVAAAVDGGLTGEGDDDGEEFPSDAQVALALRAVYARHRHDLTLTRWTLMQKTASELMHETEMELGGADLSTLRRVIERTIALIKHEEAEELSVPRNLAAAFASSITDPAKPLVDEFRFEPCAVSGVHVEGPAAAAAPAEAEPVNALAEPAPPPPPSLAMADNSPLRAIDVVVYDDDDNRHPEEQIEGCDGINIYCCWLFDHFRKDRSPFACRMVAGRLHVAFAPGLSLL